MHDKQKILLTGATGYIGGRLLGALESRGLSLRCLSRKPEMLRGRVAPTTEIAYGDCLDLASLRQAMSGIETAYYLVHSMGSAGSFEDQDRRSAVHFAQAAAQRAFAGSFI